MMTLILKTKRWSEGENQEEKDKYFSFFFSCWSNMLSSLEKEMFLTIPVLLLLMGQS